MVPVDPCTQIVNPCSFARTSIVRKAGAFREPTLVNGQGTVATYGVDAVTARGKTRCTQCHTRITDSLAFRSTLHRKILNLSGKKILFSAGPGLPSSKTTELMMEPRLFRTLKSKEEYAKISGSGTGSLMSVKAFYGVTP